MFCTKCWSVLLRNHPSLGTDLLSPIPWPILENRKPCWVTRLGKFPQKLKFSMFVVFRCDLPITYGDICQLQTTRSNIMRYAHTIPHWPPIRSACHIEEIRRDQQVGDANLGSKITDSKNQSSVARVHEKHNKNTSKKLRGHAQT